MDEAFTFVAQAFGDGLLEGVERQVAPQRVRDLPADETAAERIDDKRHVGEPRADPHIGSVWMKRARYPGTTPRGSMSANEQRVAMVRPPLSRRVVVQETPICPTLPSPSRAHLAPDF